MPHSHDFALPSCPICNEPVELTTAKSDGDGRPVHEECFAAELHREFAAGLVKGDGKEDGSWRSIAEQITHETDPHKMIQLSEKLNNALMEEERQKAERGRQNQAKSDGGGA